MATAKVIVPSADELKIVTKNEEIFPAMNVLAGINNGNKDAASTIICRNSAQVNDAWRQVKLMEKVVDYAKKVIETAVWEVSNKEELSTPVAMQNDFKWQQGAKKTNVNNVAKLFEIAAGNGISASEMGKYFKSITASNAANLLGMSEEAFLTNYGEETEVTTTFNKPTLKGL